MSDHPVEVTGLFVIEGVVEEASVRSQSAVAVVVWTWPGAG